MPDADAIAAEADEALMANRQIAPFSTRVSGFDNRAAYAVTPRLRALREARGERPVGRKIGFTNRGIWPEYGVYEPIWGYMYDTTVHEVAPGTVVDLSHLPEPRIEPEIVLGLEADLEQGMSAADIARAIGWVAHGFEIVQSIFPGWRFSAADCIADGGLHGALYLGPRQMVEPRDRAALPEQLAALTVTLSRDGSVVDSGTGSNALDGPIEALRHLVGVLADDPENPPITADEMITTGTLTRAFPVSPGQRWSTVIGGFDLPGMDVTVA
jgi:2-oxo-3-hexenedioate decarboxylase